MVEIEKYLTKFKQRDDLDRDVFEDIVSVKKDNYFHLESNSAIYRPYTQIDIYDDHFVCKSGCRGGDSEKLNEFINIPILEVSTFYEVDGITYNTDYLGRVCQVQALLPINNDIKNRPTGGKEIQKYLDVKEKTDGDEAGHLIARSLKGPNEGINIVPMNKLVNRFLYEFVNNYIREYSQQKILWKETIIYEGDSRRPKSFKIECSVEDSTIIEAELDNMIGQHCLTNTRILTQKASTI